VNPVLCAVTFVPITSLTVTTVVDTQAMVGADCTSEKKIQPVCATAIFVLNF
jgi:hypothetical protein